MITSAIAEQSDIELVSASRAGDRNAFGKIVERYQSFVCSVAYGATGNLSLSQDVAQETFVAAWKQLNQLHEPEKLNSWLGGIARNITRNTLRRLGREPVQTAETLEAAQDLPAVGKSPTDHTISREEEAILWRAIERIPENYREPLVLFYREGKSVEQTAALLELSEDAVKQRLSRGRKLLAEEVTGFVESALQNSAPGKAFTLGVLAALPIFATSAKAAAVGTTVAKSSGIAKAMSVLGVASVIFGPILGLFGAWLGTKTSIDNTSSANERKFMVKASKIAWAYIIGFDLLIAALMLLSANSEPSRGVFWVATFVVACLFFVVGLIALLLWTNRNQRRIRMEAEVKLPTVPQSASADYFEYRSKWVFLGLPLIHIASGRRPDGKINTAKGWIAMGGLSFGVLFSFGGVAIGGIAFGGVAVGVISFGGLGIGLLSIAGVAFGGWAAGGAAAVGYYAISGACAIGWMAAHGTAAFAHYFASGNAPVIAQHANDEAAKIFIQSRGFFALANPKTFSTVTGLCWLPMLLVIWQGFRTRKALREKAATPNS